MQTKDQEMTAQGAAKAELTFASGALELVRRMEITTQAELEAAVSWAAEVKERATQVTAKRDEFVKPLKQVVASITAFFDPAIKDLAESERAIKGKIETYHLEAAQRRSDLLGDIKDAPNEAARSAIIREADDHDVAPVAGLSVRETWKGEVEDESKIPREYLTPDVKKLLAVTKAEKRDPRIPGWRAFPEVSSAITAGKVKRV